MCVWEGDWGKHRRGCSRKWKTVKWKRSSALKVDFSLSAATLPFTILYNSSHPDQSWSKRDRQCRKLLDSFFSHVLEFFKKPLCLSHTPHPSIVSLSPPLHCSQPPLPISLPPSPLPPCCQLISASLRIFLSRQVTNSSLEAAPLNLDMMNLLPKPGRWVVDGI